MPATSSRQILLLLLAPLVSAIPLRAVEGQWRNLGPDGGAVYSLAVQPDDPSVMYAGVDGGVYKSVDGGATWVWAGEGLDFVSRVSSLAIDAVRASTLYAAQGKGVYRSEDGGLTWTRTGPPSAFTVAAHPRASGTVFAATSQGLYRTSNGGTRWTRLTRGLPKLCRTRAVLLDPAAPNRVYAVVEDIDSLQGGIVKSTDGGSSWRSANSGLKGLAVQVLALDRQAPETLYAGTEDAVFKSTNGGAVWKATGLSDVGLVSSLTVHPEQSGVVYAGTASGLFRSRDGGVTWSRLAQGLPEGVVNVLAFPSASSQSVFAGVSALVRPGGVFRSVDEGDSWVLSSHGLSTLGVSSVAVDPRTRDTLWVVAKTILFKSTDGGATWTQAFAGDLFPHRVIVDPFESSIVYVVFTNSRLGRTRDGGQSWEILDRPLEATYQIVADPQTPATLYAAGLGGIAKSVDRGTTWAPIPGPLTELFCHVIAISPSEPSTLYASGASSLRHAIVRTMDGGTTWTPIQEGLLALPLSFAIDPSDPMTAFTSFAGDIYRTSGGEATWKRISKPFHDRVAHPLAMSDTGTLYAAVWYDNVYASEDGVQWSPLGASPTHSAYTALAVDPLDPCRIYAGTYNRGLLVFTKSGTAECN